MSAAQMSGPAMRRQDKELKDPAVIRATLEAAPVVRVAMVDGDRPYLLPFSFVVEGDALFVHSAAHGRKLEILRRNPNVCFEVEADVAVVLHRNPCDVGVAFRSVVGVGTVSFVEDPAEKERVLRLFVDKYAPKSGREMPAHEIAKTVVWRVAIDRVTGKRSGR
jgi:nitroimidazol reductase NimA-like FMN-containing flavoprotein (pyridoxamine 5'-phosphate oxidase superfamily)